MLKKIINIVGWITFGVVVFILLNFTLKSKNICIVQRPNIEISKWTDNEFVTEDMILNNLKSKGYGFENQSSNEILLEEIEQVLLDYPSVKDVNSYKSLKGEVDIEVELRRPIVRVFDKKGNSGYIDEDGKSMILSDVFTSRVLVFTGSIDGRLSNFGVEDTIQENEMLRDIYEFASFVDQDEFWKAQIEQVYVNRDKEFEIIPKVGDHRIFFGDVNEMKLKFKKLKAFYHGITHKQWNVYDTINLTYREQIVCSKK